MEVIDKAIDLAVGGSDLSVQLRGGLRVGLGTALGNEIKHPVHERNHAIVFFDIGGVGEVDRANGEAF
jgi:hypothetical protein